MIRRHCSLPYGVILSIATLAGLGGVGPAQASADWTAVVPTCSRNTSHSADFNQSGAADGAKKAGRNPPVRYFCPIHPANEPNKASWNTLKLQFFDTTATGGGIVARLYRKSRTTGVVKEMALLSSVSGPGIQVLSTTLDKPLHFAEDAHYITIDLAREPDEASLDAHMVMLTTE